VEGQVYGVVVQSNCSMCSWHQGILSSASLPYNWVQGGGFRWGLGEEGIVLRCYPNPTHGGIWIEGLREGVYKYRIIGASGVELERGVWEVKAEGVHWDMSSYAEGLYVIEIEGKNQKWQQKILKIK
ncbi:MAG: T9SS type A sorting domain-containing protein, partial [Bacteroidia bacterium]|nr:T9SS type A sorting domain-containing protein [Bacteroidia bacterium]